MREIKFRAWRKEYGMTKPFDICHLQDRHQFDFTDGGYLCADEFGLCHEETNLMQYTGLTDKNGVEIYEGDIIFNLEYFGAHTSWGDATDNNPDKRLIVWDEETACFKWAFLEEAIRDRGCSGYSFVKSNQDEFKVIGNIHENPELLEDK